METPSVPINFVPAKSGDSFHLGVITIRIMEDGTNTGDAASPSMTALTNNKTRYASRISRVYAASRHEGTACTLARDGLSSSTMNGDVSADSFHSTTRLSS